MKVLRDLAGVQRIEQMMRVRWIVNEPGYVTLIEAVEEESVRFFGIRLSDTFWSDEDAEARPDEWDDYESKFDVVDMLYKDSAPYWAALDWDITDGKGAELPSAHWFGPANYRCGKRSGRRAAGPGRPLHAGRIRQAFVRFGADRRCMGEQHAAARRGMDEGALEDAEDLAPGRALHGRSVAGFAALDDADRGLRALVRLVELASLSVAEGDPVADRVAVREVSAGDALLPLSRQEA